jgi:hypothetical protein
MPKEIEQLFNRAWKDTGFVVSNRLRDTIRQIFVFGYLEGKLAGREEALKDLHVIKGQVDKIEGLVAHIYNPQ